jgi:D-alanine-D-alanine ligase
MAKVGLVFGGRSVEHRVSVTSARTVASGLAAAGHEVEPFGIDRGGVWVDRELSAAALAGEIEAIEAPPETAGRSAAGFARLVESGLDAVFPLVHGTWGEDGTLQGFFEIVGLPYVGAGVTASAIAMDKRLAKGLLRQAGLPVVDWREVPAAAFHEDPKAAVAACSELEFPLFVKPSVGGSSVGIRKVPDASRLESSLEFALRFDEVALVEHGLEGARELEFPLFVKPSVGGSSVGIRKVPDASRLESSLEFALRFDEVALVEHGLEGARELECALVGYASLEASVLGEVVPGREFYDYTDKYLEDGALLLAPAELEPSTEALLQKLAIDAFAAIGGTSMARVDFLLDPDEGPFINEINTLPGFTSISMYPRLWGLSGLPLADLVDRLVQDAFARHEARARLNEGIRDWLAELG